jgi:hypothetical protein
MLPPGHTSDFEPCMHKYLQQSLPKHLEKKPMKRKEKMKLYKGWKKQQKFVYMTEKKRKLCKGWTLGETS